MISSRISSFRHLAHSTTKNTRIRRHFATRIQKHNSGRPFHKSFNLRSGLKVGLQQRHTHSEYSREIRNVSGRPSASPISKHSFSIATWNVLCQPYAKSFNKYSNPDILDWTYRKQGIFTEIQKLDSDILCLQVPQQDSVPH